MKARGVGEWSQDGSRLSTPSSTPRWRRGCRGAARNRGRRGRARRHFPPSAPACNGRPKAPSSPMAAAAGGAGGGGSAALGDSGAIDYSVHEAWNEATNVYLLVVLASLALLVYTRRNKRRILRIFTLPPAAETPPEPNFYNSMKKIRLRQQLEMYSIARKYEQQQQQPPKQTESVQLSVE
ncbi:small integral membrane protein 19 [Excalfactoria chinensis]|uniref:small integral membrane protein 19 n=1 Tax=Excalfactoria chinensis TaxID=46218 RepID=UPI003B3B4F45